MASLIRENKTKAAVFLAGAALFAAGFAGERVLEPLFSRLSFYSMLALFLLLVRTALDRVLADREGAGAFWSANKPGFLFALALSAALFASARPEFRVLSDETNLLSVSRSMLAERRVDNVLSAKWYFNNLRTVTTEHEKRPFAYPFAVFAAHALTGFRPANAFAVNFVFCFLFLAALYAFLRPLYGPWAAAGGLLLAAAQPLFTVTAASGAMDLTALLFLFLSFLLLREYLRRNDAASFALFWAALLAMASARYEGGPIAAALFAWLLASKRLPAERLASWPFALTPFILLPALWQRFFYVTDQQNPAGVAAFDPANLPRNFGGLLRGLLSPGFEHPYAAAVCVLGLAAIVVIFFRLAAGGWPEKKEDRQALWLAFAALAFIMLVAGCFHFGDALHAVTARYYLPAAAALSAAAVPALARLAGTGRPFFFSAAALFLVYHPAAVENRFMNNLFGSREFRQHNAFLESVGDKQVLAVAFRPGQVTALGRGAVSFHYARANRAELMTELQRRLYKKIFVFQEIYYATGRPTPDTELGPEYQLKTLVEQQNTADSYLRISEVVPPW